MIVFDLLQYGLASVLGILLGYQMILSFVALRGRNREEFPVEKERKFAIVIPAHNEEKVISKTLYSLFGLIYPKNLCDIIVVADNCTDNTAKIARKLGAEVMERTNEQNKGKGYALRWAFDRILDREEDYDGIVVFDSDSLVSANYLNVMNWYIENGSEVIQSSDLVLPQPGVWSSEVTRIGFLLYNYVKPRAKKMIGLDMGLRGNGMCFRADILREHPWQAWSLTEDVEYGLRLLLKDVSIDFAPEAVVWAQMPQQSENAESQRMRWEMGRYPIIREYAPKLLAKSFRKRSLRYLDALADLVNPPLVNTLLFVIGMIGLNILLWAIGWISLAYAGIWGAVALMGVLHLFVGLIAAEADSQIYRSILHIPLYAFWKVKVYLKTWFNGREQEWIRTTRDHT